MAIKKIRRGFGGKTWGQRDKKYRKHRIKFWKKNCPYICRPRLCAKAAQYLERNLPAMEALETSIRYSSRYPEQKRWQ